MQCYIIKTLTCLINFNFLHNNFFFKVIIKMSGCKKTFFLHKINLSNHKNYEKEIKKKFEDVDEYFDTSNKIIIGKRINFSPLSEIAENGVRGGAVGFRRTVRMKKPTIRNVKNEELSPHQKVYEIIMKIRLRIYLIK